MSSTILTRLGVAVATELLSSSSVSVGENFNFLACLEMRLSSLYAILEESISAKIVYNLITPQNEIRI